MSLKPLTIHYNGAGEQTYYPRGNCVGFSRVTVESGDARVNQLPWVYRKDFFITEPGPTILKTEDSNTFLYEPVVTVDVSGHVREKEITLRYPLVNNGEDGAPLKIDREWKVVIDKKDFEEEDSDAIGYSKITINVHPDYRVPVEYDGFWRRNRLLTRYLVDGEINVEHEFTGSYGSKDDPSGANICKKYYCGINETVQVMIEVTKINKTAPRLYRHDVFPIVVSPGEVFVRFRKEVKLHDPEWVIEAYFVDDDSEHGFTVESPLWLTSRLPKGHRMDREIRVAGSGEKTLVATTTGGGDDEFGIMGRARGVKFTLRLDADVYDIRTEEKPWEKEEIE